jgi:hypothetical protein
MRTALSFGVLLLLLVVTLNLSAGTYDDLLPDDTEGFGVSNGTSIRIFSCGGTLQPARYRNRKLWEGIFLDGQQYSRINTETGLRVLARRPDGEVEFENFQLATVAADVEAFDAFVRAQPTGTLLAAGLMHSAFPTGTAEATQETLLASLRETFARLGAQAAPLETRFVSWAFLALRTAYGWHPLAEERSTTRGVMLVRGLASHLSRYATAPAPPARIENRMELLLYDHTDGVDFDPFSEPFLEYPIRFAAMRAFQAYPPWGPRAKDYPHRESRIRLPFVRIAHDAAFETYVGHRADRGHVCQGVRFEVIVDGEPVAERIVPFEPCTWHPWHVDLSPWEGRWVTLELRVAPLDESDWSERMWYEPTVWGEPRLVYTAGGPAPEPGLIDSFDRNRDGLLERNELYAAILAEDVDGNGILELDEVRPEFVRYLVPADADADRGVSAKELEIAIDAIFER